jgi:hypothetical protein
MLRNTLGHVKAQMALLPLAYNLLARSMPCYGQAHAARIMPSWAGLRPEPGLQILCYGPSFCKRACLDKVSYALSTK